MATTTALKQQRGKVKGTVTRICNSIDNGMNSSEAKVRLIKCEEAWNKFSEIHSQLEERVPIEEQAGKTYLEECDAEQVLFERIFFDTVGKLQKIVDEAEEAGRNVRSQLTAAVQNSIHNPNAVENQNKRLPKLPELKLQEFDGNFSNWIFFKNIFEATIHNDSSLSNAQKHKYLVGVLKGEALNVIQGFSITDDTYLSAWKLLIDTYDNQMIIIEKHLEDLFSFPTLKKEDKSESLRQLNFHIQTHVSSLKAMKQPVDHWDTVIIHLAKKHLDYAEQKEWQDRNKNCKPENMPTLEEFFKFLSERSQAYMLLNCNKNKTSNAQGSKTNAKSNTKEKKQGNKLVNLTTQVKCDMCGENHAIFHCQEWLKKSVEEKRKLLIEKGKCLNCLKSGHIAKHCRSSKCQKCQRSHNTLLHKEEEVNKEEKDAENKNLSMNLCINTQEAVTPVINIAENESSQVLLSTVLIYVRNVNGEKVTCRAILDNGAQSNLISNNFLKKLQLPKISKMAPMSAVGGLRVKSNKFTQVHLISRIQDFEIDEEFLVLPTVTERLPQSNIELSDVVIPEGARLADPAFNKPGEIDMLLGGGIYWKVVTGAPINHMKGKPALQNTRLGWIIGGELKQQKRKTETTCLKVTNEQLLDQMERFWKWESIPETKHYTKEENQCEKYFSDTVSRDETGSFVVRLPLKPEVILGESESQALKRLESLVRRLSKQPELKTEYTQFMEIYEKLGHMTLIREISNQDPSNSYFIPHQAVVRPDSQTTKVRVVFDASAKTSRGTSLNDKLMVGPNLQRDLLHIIFRFRSHEYVITSDVEKMFRQIKIHPEDRQFQQILWKVNAEDPVKVYQLNTVTYGTASAPYHAMRCLNELANIHEEEFPSAAKVIKDDFYMDDCLSGGKTVECVIKLRQQLQTVLSDGGMTLRKWRSNDKRILEDVENQSDEGSLLVLDREEACKTLGLLWNSTEDCLQFKVELPEEVPLSKREIASRVAQIFDPLGLVGPVLIKGKLLMRQLWSDGLDWDGPLSAEHLSMWKDYHSSVQNLNEIQIVRNVNPQNRTEKFNLYGFGDASEKAIGACIYAVSQARNGKYVSNLICAKSKTAPLKNVSLPRLELEAALLLTRLLRLTRDAFGDKIDQVKLWSDSMIVLGWIRTEPGLLKTFVANRVAKIQEVTGEVSWSHVSSEENPADLLTRGITSTELGDSDLWWHGPEWLRKKYRQPESSEEPEAELPEMKSIIVALTTTATGNLLDRFSSFSKLLRVVAYVQRFVHNCRKKKEERRLKYLEPDEFAQAERIVILWTQQQAFPEDFKCLLKNRNIPKKSVLKSLAPFLDTDGLIKVGGRLQRSDLTTQQRHPAPLPAKHHVTRLILEEEHRRLKHCPPEQLLHSTRQRYWLIAGRREAKKVVARCIKCFQFNPKIQETKMGNLPKERISSVYRPFTVSGVDYAGPFSTRESHRRGRIPINKAYVAVFVCFHTKAVHLELVSELTTEAFLAALQRFTARRGLCKQLFSDNGRNFVGAANSLQDLQSFLEQQYANIAQALARSRIEWKFIPAYSPHMGGLWEAAVKVMKRHLMTETQGRILTFEEMCTILCDIEAVLNSRPLTPLPNDPNDLQVITPAHFLVGDSLTQPVQLDVAETPDNRLTHWQHLRKIRQRLWLRWQREYLQELQRRVKWHESGRRVEVGSFVLLIEDNDPPLEWPRGIVTEVHPGPDGEIRVVTVRTASGTYRRSTRKVCLFPLQEEENTEVQ